MGFAYGMKYICQGNLPTTYFPTSWLRQESRTQMRPLKSIVYTLANIFGNLFFNRNEAQEQHSLLDTIFDYIFILDLQEIYLKYQKNIYYMSASGKIVLQVQNEKYSQILYLIDYIVYGFHLLYIL